MPLLPRVFWQAVQLKVRGYRQDRGIQNPRGPIPQRSTRPNPRARPRDIIAQGQSSRCQVPRRPHLRWENARAPITSIINW